MFLDTQLQRKEIVTWANEFIEDVLTSSALVMTLKSKNKKHYEEYFLLRVYVWIVVYVLNDLIKVHIELSGRN